MVKRLLTALSCVLLLFCCIQTSAQTTAQTQQTESFTSWYVGLKGGIPFGISTFSSFGTDKTRAGWDFGLYGGYNINSIFSAELSASFGKVGMSKYCNENYWLGSDGNRYFIPVSGMSGHHYSDLYSSVSMQNYGLKFNIDLLQLLPQTYNTPWMLQASPMVSAVVTNATIKQISNDSKVMDGGTNIHFGIGGDLSVGYRITEKLNAHIYSGVTYLTGSQFDGMPEYKHSNNIIWKSGIKLSWSFGKRKRAIKRYTQTITVAPIVKKSVPVVVEPVVVELVVVEPVEPVVVEAVEPIEQKTDTVVVIEQIIMAIYFEQDNTYLPSSEFEKLEELLELMKSDLTLKITIIGWANITGKAEANQRVSRARAINVRWWLAQRGISSTRIIVCGKGVDLTTEDMNKARRVDVVNQLK